MEQNEQKKAWAQPMSDSFKAEASSRLWNVQENDGVV